MFERDVRWKSRFWMRVLDTGEVSHLVVAKLDERLESAFQGLDLEHQAAGKRARTISFAWINQPRASSNH